MNHITAVHLGNGPLTVENIPVYDESPATEACNAVGLALMEAGYEGVSGDALKLKDGKTLIYWMPTHDTPGGALFLMLLVRAVQGIMPPEPDAVLRFLVDLAADDSKLPDVEALLAENQEGGQ